MIHGRFQPFHNGHLEYLKGAAERSDEVFVGITNPDPARIKPEASDPLRHLPESNPYSYVERLLMVKAAARRRRIEPERLHVIPFPGQRAGALGGLRPPDVVQFIRLFSDWGGTKLERLREAGYEVVVLDEGAEKESRAPRCGRRCARAATGSGSCRREWPTARRLERVAV